jgi:hypothetical protein
MAQSEYEVFIVHHGWRENADDPKLVCMKGIALQIRAKLHEAPKVTTFVDEADLVPGANARCLLKQKLIDCEVGATTMCGLNVMQQGFLVVQISSIMCDSVIAATAPADINHLTYPHHQLSMHESAPGHLQEIHCCYAVIQTVAR